MIRINLLSGDRPHGARAGALDLPQRVAVGCSVILLATAVFIGWRFWSLRDVSTQLTEQLAASDQELQRLEPVLEGLTALDQRRMLLTERVDLIERLREERTGPVRMLDQISRSLPDGLWLSTLRQTDDGVVVRGRATTLHALSDFVANLEGSGQVDPPVEIIDSQTEDTPQGEVVTFELRASFDGAGP